MTKDCETIDLIKLLFSEVLLRIGGKGTKTMYVECVILCSWLVLVWLRVVLKSPHISSDCRHSNQKLGN